jgi:hypothetical protein
VNDRNERGGRGERGVRVVYVFWVEKFGGKDLLFGRRLRQWYTLVSLSLSLSPLEVVSTPEWLGFVV